jgi:hypothetical protein
MHPIMRRKKSGIASFLVPVIGAAVLAASLGGCVAAEEPLPVVNGAKRVFASSQLTTGNLKGLAGADSMCGVWAAAAGLGGSWKAFLSTSGTGAVSAASRISDVGPWYNVNQQTKVFNNKTGFTVGAITAIRTEYNETASGSAWTGTLASGAANGTQNCSNWTNGTTAYGSVGTPSGTVDDGTALWMASGGNIPTCAVPARVYCFEQ